jgi:hypothetical protein
MEWALWNRGTCLSDETRVRSVRQEVIEILPENAVGHSARSQRMQHSLARDEYARCLRDAPLLSQRNVFINCGLDIRLPHQTLHLIQLRGSQNGCE